MHKNIELHVITTCTNRKKHTELTSCLLDTCQKKNYQATINEWIKQLSRSMIPRYSARNLYSGSHWKESQQCVTVAKENGFDAKLWILSAGWGLISAEEKICSYSATFASGENSIHNVLWPKEFTIRDRCRIWWEQINTKRELSQNWKLSNLAQSKNAKYLFILSKEYYLAIEPDLMRLIGAGYDVFIISAGLYSENSIANPMVKDHILPFNDKYKQIDKYLNHTNTALNARLAVWLLTNHSGRIKKGVPFIYKFLKELERSLPEIKRRKVEKMTDDEVLSFIDKHYDPDSNSATKLLKRLRHEVKKSCEQKRFGKLFQQYKDNYSGGLFNG